MGSKYWDIPMNWIGGCSSCSIGCVHCWAADGASKRLAKHPLYKGLTKNGKWTGEVRVMPEYIKVIGGKPKIIFWNNMSDMFHPEVRFEDIDRAFVAMALMKQHTHLVLTKRIERMAEYLDGSKRATGTIIMTESGLRGRKYSCKGWPLPNVHLGATICNQEEANKIIPILLQIPAAHRWISAEPLLGEIKLSTGWLCVGIAAWDNKLGPRVINRVVVGCESGPKRRPCKLEHIRSIVQQCKAAGVGCYVKQIPINGKVEHDMSKFPEDLQVRDEICGI